MVRCVCGNCGRIEKFDSFQAAFDAGWDTIDRFGYTACDKCLGMSVYLPMMYAQQARAAQSEDEYNDLMEKCAKATLGDFGLNA